MRLMSLWQRITIASALLLFFALPAQAKHTVERSDLSVVVNIPLANEVLLRVYKCGYGAAIGGRAGPHIIVPHDGEGPFRGTDTDDFEMLFCPIGTLEKLKQILPPDAFTTVEPELSETQSWLVWAINNLLWLQAVVGAWLVGLASQLVGPLLGLRSFITHPMVATGWPIVQGIANIGFMMALIFIALATTLRIESMGAKKMLPRLFLAAILINFSLVIAGIILDASRVLMAVMVQSISGGDLNKINNIGGEMLRNSGLVSAAFDTGTLAFIGLKIEADAWSSVATVYQATIIIWGLAIGLGILIGGLLIRYIILILLLIVSPIAYLAIAFPNTGGFATKWWSMFIKYVLYGPIALLVLILLVRLTGSDKDLFNQTKDAYDPLTNIISILVTIAMCIAAAMSGKYLGTIGAGAIISSANNFRKNNRGARAYIGTNKFIAGSIGRATGFQPIKKTQAAYKGFMTERDKAKKREEATLQKQSRVAKWAEKRYANVGVTDKQQKARQAVSQGITAFDSGHGAFSAYTPDSQEKITKLQDRYPNFAKIMRTSGSATEASDAMTKDKKLWDAIKQDAPAITTALTQHFAVKDVLESNTNLSLENIVNAASGLSKEEIGTLLRTGNTQRIELMLSDVNVMKNMADDDKAKALAGDFGEVVQRRVLSHVQELSRRDAAKG